MKTEEIKITNGKNVFKSILLHTFLISVALTCLLPLLWMVRSSFMTLDTIFSSKSLIPATFEFSNYVKAWTGGNFGVYFLNSVIYTTSVVFGIVIISSLAAYAFSRLKFPGKNFLFYMFVAAMMIPLPGSFVPLVVLMNKIGLANTRIGYILCMINVGLSVSILLLKVFFDKMSPDLEDAARIDGCSKLGVWWNVALPMARPSLAVVVIYNSLNVWNEFILASLLLNENDLMPLQQGLAVFRDSNQVDYPVLMAGLVIAAVPVVVIYLLMQKHIIKGLSSGATFG